MARSNPAKKGAKAAATAAPAGADKNSARARARADQHMMSRFRRLAASIARVDPRTGSITARVGKNIGGVQNSVEVFEGIEPGQTGTIEVWGQVKNIPKSLRSKRTAADVLDEATVADNAEELLDEKMNGLATPDTDEEAVEDDNVAKPAAAASSKKKQKAATSSATKKQKKGAASSSVRRDASARRENNDTKMPPPPADSTGTRRSTRVTSSSSVTPRPSARHEPINREDQRENHVTHDDDTHQIDEYNFRRSNRAASDDLNSLSDRMNIFDIESEAGSESTRAFSRESSMDEPVASTSRL